MRKLRLWSVLIGIWAAAWGPGPAARAAASPQGPSFDCTGPHDAVEREICASSELAAADRTMANLFAVARVSPLGAGPSNELAIQREFVKSMRGCAQSAPKEPLRQCLQSLYDQRNNDLAIAAVMRAPDLAMPTLRKIDPAFAPVLEAVRIWALEPRSADWAAPARAAKRARVLALLSPFMTELLTNEAESFGRDILASSSADGVSVKRVEDVLISERRFAAFLNIIGPYIDDADWAGRNGAGRRSLPCAAIIAHPSLLGATTAAFGSTLDQFVLDDDCEETLPPTPSLQALSDRLLKTWPPCDGSIRFSAYRNFAAALDEARLGLVRHALKTEVQRRRGVSAADLGAARRELEADYTANYGKAPGTASAMATDAISGVLTMAHQCD